jgi:uncharacterized protein involved in exopolysaccharide biosynthesis
VELMNRTTSSSQHELTFRLLVEILWAGKWWIVATTVSLILVAAVAARLTPKQYMASVVISPATDTGTGGSLSGGAMLSQLGGLASLAGINLGGDSKKSESLAILQSEVLTEKFIDQNHLLPILFPTLWDPEHKRWIAEDPRRAPTLQDGSGYFRAKLRKLVTDSKTGLLTLEVSWFDPQLAANWATGLVQMTNDYVRSKAIQQSEENIAYLTDQAAKTDVAGVKQVIYSLMQNEISKVMLARGNEEYAFKVIDPAIVPESASFPQTRLWMLAGAAAGLLISVTALLARAAWKAPV